MPADLLDELAELETAETRPRRRVLLLLVVPLLTALWPPLFNRHHPTLIGLPFFVCYQLAAVAFGGFVTWCVYRLSGRA